MTTRGGSRRTVRPLTHGLVSVTIAVIALASLVVLPAAPALADSGSGSPTLGLSVSATPQRARTTDTTHIVGTGWPANAPIAVSTCGNNGLNGSVDCNTAQTFNTISDATGNFQFDMTFGRPPKPCPCVIHTFSPNLSSVNDFPVELLDMPSAPPVKESSTRTLKVDISVSGSGPVASWFGFPAERSLDATITNTGSLPVLNPPAYIYLGKGQDPTTLLSSPALGSVNPGQTVTVAIPFELPALSFGSYTVKIDIPGMDTPTTATATTATYPWLLLIAVWLAIQIPLLGLYRRRDEDDDSHLIELDDPFGGLSLAGVGSGAAVATLVKPGLNGGSSPVGTAALPSIPAWALTKLTGLNPANPTPTLTAAAAPTNGNGRMAAAAASAYGVSQIRRFVEAPPTNGHPVSSRVVVGGVASNGRGQLPAPGPDLNSSPPAPGPTPPTQPLPSPSPSPPLVSSPSTGFGAGDPLDTSVPFEPDFENHRYE